MRQRQISQVRFMTIRHAGYLQMSSLIAAPIQPGWHIAVDLLAVVDVKLEFQQTWLIGVHCRQDIESHTEIVEEIFQATKN